MKDETRVWLRYAEENLEAARLLLHQNLYNPCLQNVQQCVEKKFEGSAARKISSVSKNALNCRVAQCIDASWDRCSA